MKFIFIDINKEIVQEFKKQFGDQLNCEFVCKSVTDLMYDFEDEKVAWVSPANSFGYMRGGVDYYLNSHVLLNVEELVQDAIEKLGMDLLPVGKSITVQWNSKNWLICSPTMKTPSNIQGTDNVYRAFTSTLNEVKKHPEFDCVVIPGMGTSCGGMTPEESVSQMKLAWNESKLF